MKEFLEKKDVKISLTRYGIEAMGAMTLGLFASLIMGTILWEIGARVGWDFLAQMGDMARGATGYAIGVAVAFGLKAPPLVMLASAVVGFAGFYDGGPAGAFLAALVGTEIGKLVSKETKVDIIVTPSVTIFVGVLTAELVGAPIDRLMQGAGAFIMWATELMPVVMGGIVAMVMGIILTSPISSAALSIMFHLDGLAAGAAVAGTAANMIGFAVASYRENKIGGLISQGLGTSMLQLPNIIKNPRIWIPPIIASIVAGIVSAAVFGMESNRYGGGMGTSGLVGQFNTLTVMGYSATVFIQIGIVHFIIPAVISLLVCEYMRKKEWIKFGDMSLQ